MSVRIAKRATSTAPCSTKGSLLAASPSKIGVPRVKAPTVEPIVAVPIAIVTDTLTPAMIQAALGMEKAEADAALTRLRQDGLAEFDVDESGTPVYRVQKGALEARKHKGW